MLTQSVCCENLIGTEIFGWARDTQAYCLVHTIENFNLHVGMLPQKKACQDPPADFNILVIFDYGKVLPPAPVTPALPGLPVDAPPLPPMPGVPIVKLFPK